MSHGHIQMDSENRLIGAAITRSINENFWLVPNPEAMGMRSPTHLIMGKAPAGHKYQIGIAYQYEISRGEFSGFSGFNLFFNDPDFGAEGVKFSCFPKGQNAWNVSLDRSEKPKVEEKAAA